ncbi:kinase-associated lipoprotein B [Lederbergia citrea]|uniref:Kinase-associated lipoprotein B n=1 Tax=Lederbergia citrea TaxID=2833581 RepID=A0A942UP03_9BACI|nr:kinase-associated lipoprotein B [Lederbergia citrea]MBS4178579.1 kinase-associated lipoprotein B [Lederbergia citrea]MBS4222872.1 kinase-associated lipoprotein B [Lederbergia citrea]
MEIGQIVTAFNKTGKYIGEITNVRQDTYTVRILSVLTHPKQGDLHNPNQVDVPFFHERKALAFREQANIPLKMVKPFEGQVPNYNDSLKAAVEKLSGELESKPEDAYYIRSLEALRGVIKEYELMYSIKFE